jgi:hypothetical protein
MYRDYAELKTTILAEIKAFGLPTLVEEHIDRVFRWQ